MNYRVVTLLAGIAFLSSATARAFDPHDPSTDMAEASTFNGPMQTCFSHAMVGMDSVINARLGLLPERVVELAAITPKKMSTNNQQDIAFDEPFLRLMLAAYLWKGSPHSYAIKVFYECARNTPVVVDRSDFLR